MNCEKNQVLSAFQDPGDVSRWYYTFGKFVKVRIQMWLLVTSLRPVAANGGEEDFAPPPSFSSLLLLLLLFERCIYLFSCVLSLMPNIGSGPQHDLEMRLDGVVRGLCLANHGT